MFEDMADKCYAKPWGFKKWVQKFCQIVLYLGLISKISRDRIDAWLGMLFPRDFQVSQMSWVI